MSYCTKIYLPNGDRVDLFSPSIFRVRMAQLDTQEIPDIYDIPFAVGKIDDWKEVEYEIVKKTDSYYLIQTSEIKIFVLLRLTIGSENDLKINKFMVKTLDDTPLYPSGENVYGMFSNKCIVFDSAAFFGERTLCDRDSKWFYNKKTGLYDIFLENGKIYDLYFIYAKNYKDGYQKFNTLVGAEPMLSKKGYGFFQTQFLGEKGTQETVLRTVEEFRKREIPLDTFIIDLDWGDGVVNGKGVRWGDGIDWDIHFRSPLTVEQMLQKMKDQNVETMIIHHSIPAYKHRCNEAWVSKEYDPDIWWEKMKNNAEIGVIGTWQDTRKTDITDSRIYNGLQAIMGNKRCIFMGNYELWQDCGWTKESHSVAMKQRVGGRRTPFRWTGDCDTKTWHELKFQIKGITNHQGALKGISYLTNDACVGSDTALAVRSIQFLCFTAIARSHNPKPWHTSYKAEDLANMMAIVENNTKTVDADSVEAKLSLDKQDLKKQECIKSILGLRYRLLPYIYTLAHEVYETGLPFTRPLMVEFEEDNLCNQNQFPYEYMFGENILVAPVYDENKTKRVYLPAGRKWYDYFDGKEYEGGQVITVDTSDLMKMPVFIKQGGIVPLQEAACYIEHGKKLDHVEFLVYPDSKGKYLLYEDDGMTLDYQKGIFAITEIVAGKDENGLFIKFNKPQGDISVLPEKRSVAIRFLGQGEYKSVCEYAKEKKDGNDLLIEFEMDTAKEFEFRFTE